MARNEDARFWMTDDNKKKETYLIWFGKYGNAELIRDSAKGSAYGTLTADQAKQLKRNITRFLIRSTRVVSTSLMIGMMYVDQDAVSSL